MNKIVLNRDRLICCRRKLGMSKQAAAKKMQLSQPAYLRYESGERTPSIHVIHYMANMLNTSVDYLIGKTDDPKPCSYVVNVSDNPELFAFIELYNFSNSATQKSLLTYIQKISNLI